MVEQVDTTDLKSVGSNPVPVRFRLAAPDLEQEIDTMYRPPVSFFYARKA